MMGKLQPPTEEHRRALAHPDTVRRVAQCVIGPALVATLSGCLFDGVTFYEVLRTPTDECDILPQGEFCVTQDELSPPVIEVWSVETRGDEVRVFIDDEIWVGAPADEDADPGAIQAEKQAFVAVDPGPCATTTTRALDVLATWADLTGTLRETTRLDGPEACGETPRGERTTHRVDGTAVAAP